MIYRAQVLDNSSFKTTGKIRVRISRYFNGSYPDDLSDNPESITEGLYYYDQNNSLTLKHQDDDVLVYSPFGGGYDYGLFFLPQVNSTGLVMQIGNPLNESREYVWLGNVFDMNNGTIKMPSDKMSNANGIENNSSNIDIMDGALIIKLRSTHLADQTNPIESKDDIDWKQSPIENLIVVNKDKILIEHAINEDKTYKGNATISLDAEKSSISYLIDDIRGEISLDASGTFSIEAFSGNEGSSIRGNKDGIETLSVNKTENTLITQTPSEISLLNGGTGVGMTKDTLTIKSANEINLDAKNVRLGAEGLKVVMASADIKSFALTDGVVLTTSNTIYG